MSGRILQAVIFDMDGLMFDTERLGWRLLNQAGAEFGCQPLTLVQYSEGIGKTGEETQKIFSQICAGDRAAYAAIEARFWELQRAFISRGGPPKKPGLTELLQLLEKRALPRAVASSTRTSRVEEILRYAGLREHFSVVVGGDQAPRSKPAPDIFLLAAERLGYAPKNCLILEDSFAGVCAGHAAGACVIMVPDILQPTDEVRAQADQVLESLYDVRDQIEDGTLRFAP